MLFCILVMFWVGISLFASEYSWNTKNTISLMVLVSISFCTFKKLFKGGVAIDVKLGLFQEWFFNGCPFGNWTQNGPHLGVWNSFGRTCCLWAGSLGVMLTTVPCCYEYVSSLSSWSTIVLQTSTSCCCVLIFKPL